MTDKMSSEDKDNRFPRKDRIKKEASDWVSSRDRGFTPEEQDAFFEWLAEDPEHAEAYHQRQSVWSEMNVLADWKPEHSLEPNPDLLALAKRPTKRYFWASLVGMAALFIFGLFTFLNREGNPQSESVLLAAGEGASFYEFHVLEDGSAVELNRGAQVSIRFTEGKRLVDLLSGEAHFTVAKDLRRPFIVRARGTVVQAVGTAFNVMLNAEEVEVIVTEGRVLMNPSIASTQESVIDERNELVQELNAGERSVVPLHSDFTRPVVEEIPKEVIDRRLAWKTELLDFTDTPLSDVILEFNRRNHTQIVIGDAALSDLPITAAFRPHKLNEFVELLVLMENIEVERDGVSKIVLRRNE